MAPSTSAHQKILLGKCPALSASLCDQGCCHDVSSCEIVGCVGFTHGGVVGLCVGPRRRLCGDGRVRGSSSASNSRERRLLHLRLHFLRLHGAGLTAVQLAVAGRDPPSRPGFMANLHFSLAPFQYLAIKVLPITLEYQYWICKAAPNELTTNQWRSEDGSFGGCQVQPK